MALFEKFHRWLRGSFVCRKCGRRFHTMCFGFGEAICPDCYDGERQFLFFDNSYWLNRIIDHLINPGARPSKPHSLDPALMHQAPIQAEIEMTG